MQRSHVIYIVGPTGVGKSAVALEIADRIGAEIISADSMQVYRGMDIITAKPSSDELKRIPHHLLDVISVNERFDVGRFVEEADKLIESITSRGKKVLVVGGTGMYVRSLIDGLFEGPGRNETIRGKLTEKLEKQGPEKLYEELRTVDPAAARKMHPHNTRRVIRALEVFLLTGKPFSSFHTEWKEKKNACMIGLRRERDDLYKRIDTRVEMMIEAGLVDEVKNLILLGIENNAEAMQAIGVKEILLYLRDEMSLDEALTLMKRNSRRYAKRQMTWFNNDERIQWVDLVPADFSEIQTPGQAPDETIASGVEKVMEILGNLKLDT